MRNEVSMGKNRTGAQMARLGTKEILAYANERLADVPPDSIDDIELRRAYADEADSVGSVPLPGTVKSVATTVIGTLKGDKPTVLIDKLGERLAFERTGVRLYEAMMTKCLAAGERSTGNGDNGGDVTLGSSHAMSARQIDLEGLKSLRDEEESHFKLLVETMTRIGADPTAMTPCADILGQLAIGPMQILNDPRTTVAQGLSALLTMELADNASWQLLADLAGEMGYEEMAMQFTIAQQAEERHVERVRGWLRAAVMEEAV